MSRFLVLCASSHGQTRKIASRIAQQLRDVGHHVDVVDIVFARNVVPPAADYDVVVLGSRVHFGRHASEVGSYIREHRVALSEMPTGFFSVSMAAASSQASVDPNGYLRVFFDSLGWRPTRAIAFAGALPYRRYGLVLRAIMKHINKVAGHPTDTAVDHELTNWGAVDAFASDLASLVRPRVGQPAVFS